MGKQSLTHVFQHSTSSASQGSRNPSLTGTEFVAEDRIHSRIWGANLFEPDLWSRFGEFIYLKHCHTDEVESVQTSRRVLKVIC